MVERFGEHCIRGTVAAVGQCFTLQRQAVCLEGQPPSGFMLSCPFFFRFLFAWGVTRVYQSPSTLPRTPPCLRPGTMSGVSGILAPAEEAVIKGHIKDVLQAAFKGWGMDCDSAASPRRRLAFPVLVDTSATLHASLHSGKRPPGMTLPHLAVLAYACTPQAVGALGEL
jgi:hypothetical protein